MYPLPNSKAIPDPSGSSAYSGKTQDLAGGWRINCSGPSQQQPARCAGGDAARRFGRCACLLGENRGANRGSRKLRCVFLIFCTPPCQLLVTAQPLLFGSVD